MADLGAIALSRSAAYPRTGVVLSTASVSRRTAVAVRTVSAVRTALGAKAPFNFSTVRQGTRRVYRFLPFWITALPPHSVPINGILSGVVTIGGAPTPNTVVRAYFRDTGVLIGETRTDATGSFTFANLDPAGLYYVIALDDITAGPAYNAQIRDAVNADPV